MTYNIFSTIPLPKSQSLPQGFQPIGKVAKAAHLVEAPLKSLALTLQGLIEVITVEYPNRQNRSRQDL
jgi:hypothetical protein